MSITTERRRLADVGLIMRRREDWGAVFKLLVDGRWVDGYTTSRPVEVAELLVGHIAVVNDPGDLLGTEDQVMRNVERIGIQRFQNTGFSYNGAAFNTGRLYEGQPLERRGAHTVNDRRRSSCTMSGCPSRGDGLTAPSWNNNVNARALVAPQMPGDPCTDKQVVSFARWGAALKLAGFATREARWHGHRCFAAKDCPGNEVWLRLDDIADLTADYVRAGHVGDQPEEDEDMPTAKEVADALLEDNRFITQVRRATWESPVGGVTGQPSYLDHLEAKIAATGTAATIGNQLIEDGKTRLTVGIALQRLYNWTAADISDADPVAELTAAVDRLQAETAVLRAVLDDVEAGTVTPEEVADRVAAELHERLAG